MSLKDVNNVESLYTCLKPPNDRMNLLVSNETLQALYPTTITSSPAWKVSSKEQLTKLYRTS